MPPRKVVGTLLALLCAGAIFLAFAQPADGATRKERRLIHRVNEVRANFGLPRLRMVSTIQRSAHSWAVYLQRRDAFYHGRLAGGVSENLGWLTCRGSWPRAIVRMWLRSPGHRRNLLDRSAHRLGVGVATGGFSRYNCTHMAVTRFR